jgi:pimeloyl-ACP methyl ester carboxylesterase
MGETCVCQFSRTDNHPDRMSQAKRLHRLSDMAELAFSRRGVGAPIVLLHALGSSRYSFDPIIPALARHFDVIAIDLPGFGDSEPFSASVEPTPAALAEAVAEQLDQLGVQSPHLVGNSLGGWVALELAAIHPTASVALLAPAGLWRGNTPLYDRASLRATRWLSRHAARPLSPLLEYRLVRGLVLGQTHGRPMHMTPQQARAAVYWLATCPGFEATLKATANRRYVATRPINAPITVAFGSRDLVLLKSQSRHLDQLPPGTYVEVLPRCGHLPMADDPSTVSNFILRSTKGALSVRRAA